MKRKLVYLFMIITAICAGYFVGKLCVDKQPYIAWLGKTMEFGFDTTSFNMRAVVMNLGMHFSINFLQIILIIVAIALAPKVSDAIK